MKLEAQVCNLWLAKRLKELGVKQASQFYWSTSGRDQAVIRLQQDSHSETWSAFTVAELGEMLPARSPSYRLTSNRRGSFTCQAVGVTSLHGETEADARAKMLIYLMEKGLVS